MKVISLFVKQPLEPEQNVIKFPRQSFPKNLNFFMRGCEMLLVSFNCCVSRVSGSLLDITQALIFIFLIFHE